MTFSSFRTNISSRPSHYGSICTRENLKHLIAWKFPGIEVISDEGDPAPKTTGPDDAICKQIDAWIALRWITRRIQVPTETVPPYRPDGRAVQMKPFHERAMGSALTRENLRIFQVDDSEDFIQIAQIFLEDCGFKQPVMSFTCGVRAIEHLAVVIPDQAPDIILLDLIMPGLAGGLEVLKWVRNRYVNPNIPVYFLTGSDEIADREKAADLGVTQYLLKMEFYHELPRILDQFIADRNYLNLVELSQLPEPLAELAHMGELSRDMIIITDPDGRIEWVNENFSKVCGYTLPELRGKKPGRILQGPSSDPIAEQQLHEAIQTAKPCECTILNYKKDGTPYTVKISLGPIYEGMKLHGHLAVEQVVG